MIIIELAEIVFRINNQYPFVEELCRDYIVKKEVDFEISISFKEINKEKLRSKYNQHDGYYESLVVYRKICNKIADYDGVLCHCAVVAIDNKAYAFSAKSGVGKSTHIDLWKKMFGDRVTIVNGDKPIIRLKNRKLYVYGTPWCGKEGWNTNTSVVLAGFCLLERDSENKIKQVRKELLIKNLFNQILIPDTKERIEAVMRVMNYLIENIPCYKLQCTISNDAVKVAYNGLHNV